MDRGEQAGLCRGPRFPFQPPHSIERFIIHSESDLSMTRKKQKTYRRFFGTIFFGGAPPALLVAGQLFATQEIPQKRKYTKKSAK
jgi:hypothetical protein